MDILRCLVPKKFWGRVVVAGGYAACPPLANDVDVWVLGVEEQTEQEEIRSFLDEAGFETLSHDEVDYLHVTGTNLIARSIPWGNRTVQVLVNAAPTPLHLLDQFDLSPHQVAINPAGYVFTPEGWSGLEVVKVNVPAVKNLVGTVKRIGKLQSRYRSVIDMGSVYEMGQLHGMGKKEIDRWAKTEGWF